MPPKRLARRAPAATGPVPGPGRRGRAPKTEPKQADSKQAESTPDESEKKAEDES